MFNTCLLGKVFFADIAFITLFYMEAKIIFRLPTFIFYNKVLFDEE
jgi:hypothetical protein